MSSCMKNWHSPVWDLHMAMQALCTHCTDCTATVTPLFHDCVCMGPKNLRTSNDGTED